MQEHFSGEIESLKSSLLKMASLVDDQVEKAITALETGNIELCKGIKGKDNEVDAYENLIHTQCENVLALFQPVATDLRFVLSALMINTQLERCGDIAVNVAQRVKKTGEFHSLIEESKILDMAKESRGMVKDAIDSFINLNTEQADKILDRDQIVDKHNKTIFKFLVAKMQADPSLIEPASHMLVLSRNLERLADHATNIAEEVVFYINAEIIAHRKKREKERTDDGN